MLSTLKAEFRKLLTVRSTYIVTASVLVGIFLLSFFVLGQQQLTSAAHDSGMLYDAVYRVMSLFATFSAIIAILLVTHEYRYNTIGYTLTAANRRLKVLVSKTIVVIVYSLSIATLVALIGYFATKWGISVKHAPLIAQHFPVVETIWQLGAYVLSYTLLGLMIGFLLRGVVGAIVVLFFTPVVEQLLGLLLKGNTKYLPFQALDRIAAPSSVPVFGGGAALTHLMALGVFALYFVVLATVTTIMFVRRDAN